MTSMTGPDCAVMCNLINTRTHTHTHRRGVLTINRQPVGPLVSTAAITIATGINHVDSVGEV